MFNEKKYRSLSVLDLHAFRRQYGFEYMRYAENEKRGTEGEGGIREMETKEGNILVSPTYVEGPQTRLHSM